MKHNLANRPKYPEEAKVKNDYIRHGIDCDDWFEDFEKELRAKRDKEAKKVGWDIADYVRISEVLGDDKR